MSAPRIGRKPTPKPALTLPLALPAGPLLTVRETAKRLGDLSEWTVWRLIWRGELPSVKVAPKCRRVLAGDVDAFIAERRFARSPATRRADP